MASCQLRMANHARDNEFLAKEKLRTAQEILKARTGNRGEQLSDCMQAVSSSQIQGQASQITLNPPPPAAVPVDSPAVEAQPLDSLPSMLLHSPSPPPLDFDDTGAHSDSSRESAPSSPVSEGTWYMMITFIPLMCGTRQWARDLR